MLTLDVAVLLISKYGFTVTGDDIQSFIGDNMVTASTFSRFCDELEIDADYVLCSLVDVKRYINHLNLQRLRIDNPCIRHNPAV